MSDDEWGRIEMADIRCGEFFWECETGRNKQFEAMADAVTQDGYVTLQACSVATGEPQAFMMCLGAEWSAYVPRLYRQPQYRTRYETP